VLDPRYKLDVYLQTQYPIELRASAKLAIEISYEKYSEMHSRRETMQKRTGKLVLVEKAVSEKAVRRHFQQVQAYQWAFA
jgi:hypothetical protein